MKFPKRVVIVGGTHGNEWTGIQIVQHYQDHLKKKFPDLELEFILANPEAHQKNCRFKEEDLNRAFQFLKEDRTSYEHLQAKEIKQLIDQAPCLILDLHTTTSNMGKTVIVPHYNPLMLALCAELTQAFHDCRIIGAPDPNKKYLASQSEQGLILEIGPIANGVIDARILEATLLLIEFILEVVASSGIANKGSLEIFEEARDVYYPRDDSGQLTGYIHSDFQGSDFQAVAGEFKAFKNFNGEEIKIKCDEKLYPIFINEAAYYPQHLAFTLCRKKVLSY